MDHSYRLSRHPGQRFEDLAVAHPCRSRTEDRARISDVSSEGEPWSGTTASRNELRIKHRGVTLWLKVQTAMPVRIGPANRDTGGSCAARRRAMRSIT